MEGIFEVTCGGQTVGTVELGREGLYVRLRCRCRVQDNAIHRLYAGGEKIGVLIPEGGELVLDTKVAAKRMKPGCSFTLDGQKETFIPICPGEDFCHLEKLRRGRLVYRDGLPGLVFPA